MKKSLITFLVLLLIAATLTGCTKSEDQYQKQKEADEKTHQMLQDLRPQIDLDMSDPFAGI